MPVLKISRKPSTEVANAGVDIRIESEGIIAISPSWGGEILAGITFNERFGTGFATIQPHAFQAIEQNGDPGSIERIAINDIDVPAGMELVSRSLESAQHRKLEEALRVEPALP